MPIPFLVAKFFLNLRVYELLALPHSLLPTSRHETAVSIIRLQIWNQDHLFPLPTSNLYRNLGVFIEIFRCTTYYGQTQINFKLFDVKDLFIDEPKNFYRLVVG